MSTRSARSRLDTEKHISTYHRFHRRLDSFGGCRHGDLCAIAHHPARERSTPEGVDRLLGGASLQTLAERRGFEPRVRGNLTTVFETAPFDHSGTSPQILNSTNHKSTNRNLAGRARIELATSPMSTGRSSPELSPIKFHSRIGAGDVIRTHDPYLDGIALPDSGSSRSR